MSDDSVAEKTQAQAGQSIELTSEQKKILFDEFRAEQKKLLDEAAEKKRVAALVEVATEEGNKDDPPGTVVKLPQGTRKSQRFFPVSLSALVSQCW